MVAAPAVGERTTVVTGSNASMNVAIASGGSAETPCEQ
jgi:hypothetical protein